VRDFGQTKLDLARQRLTQQAPQRVIESPDALRNKYVTNQISIEEFEAGVELAFTVPHYRNLPQRPLSDQQSYAKPTRSHSYRFSSWLGTVRGTIFAAFSSVAVISVLALSIISSVGPAHAHASTAHVDAVTIEHVCGARAAAAYSAYVSAVKSPSLTAREDTVAMKTVLASGLCAKNTQTR
jgi:hypothetical protein